MEQKFIKLTENFYFMEHEDHRDRPVLGYFKGKTASVMIDGGTSIKHAQEFFNHLKEKHLNHPDFCVLTHWHFDHIFGLTEVNCPLIGHENTKRIMNEKKDFDWAEKIKSNPDDPINNEFSDGVFDIGIRLPDITFENRITIDLGLDTLIVEKVQADHTDDCCVIFSPMEKVLMFGDCLYVGSSEERGYYYHKDVYLNLLKKLLSFEAEYYIDSHRGIFKHEDMEKMYAEFEELTALIEKYDTKEEFDQNISDSLKKNLPQETLDWYYKGFRNGMKD